MRDEQGFTLIEMIVVVVVLGVLAAVVLLAVTGIADRGQTTASQADRTTMIHAEEAYLAQHSAAGVYAAEGTLVPGFLGTVSKLHDICLSDDHKTYEIIDAGATCSPGMVLAL